MCPKNSHYDLVLLYFSFFWLNLMRFILAVSSSRSTFTSYTLHLLLGRHQHIRWFLLLLVGRNLFSLGRRLSWLSRQKEVWAACISPRGIEGCQRSALGVQFHYPVARLGVNDCEITFKSFGSTQSRFHLVLPQVQCYWYSPRVPQLVQ